MVEITVTVGDGHRLSLDKVAATLRDNGMQVRDVLGSLGIITGSAPDERLKSLEAVEGVEAVEEELTFQLPSPDSPVQ